jgi:hypothetical protein
MDIKDLKVEKIALLLLSLFVLILFVDYSFNITELIKQKYKIDINDMSKLRYLVLISIVPIVSFISKTEWDNKPNILSNSILPFLTFILGFYLYKIKFFQDTSGLFLLFGIQLISSLTYLITISLFLSKLITLFRKLNKCIFDFKCCKKDDNIKETDKEFLNKTLELTNTLNQSMIDRLRSNA